MKVGIIAHFTAAAEFFLAAASLTEALFTERWLSRRHKNINYAATDRAGSRAWSEEIH